MKPDGRLFIHVFTHKTSPYRFDLNDEGDDKSLKTGSSKRVVPVHSHLLQRGLAEFLIR